jgi:protein-disulfide isomerase
MPAGEPLPRIRALAAALLAAALAAALVATLVPDGAAARVPAAARARRSAASARSASARAVEKQVIVSLRGIPESGSRLGRADAPVTLQYFGDLECPFCRRFEFGALRSIIDRWVRGGELRIEYRSLETATREPGTFERQQVAALAAGAQGRLWYFIETFYREQGEEGSGYVTQAYLARIAAQVPGLKIARWRHACREARFAAQLARDEATAAREGLEGTPAFLIGRSGAKLRVLEASSLINASSFDEAIEELLRA